MWSFDVTASVGALEIGTIISVFLFGLVTVQTHIYYRNFPLDKRGPKILIAVVWLLELGHTMAVTHALYTITVTDYGQPQTLNDTPRSLFTSVLLSGLISHLCQAFFAHRVYSLSRNMWITVFCWILLFLRCVAILVLGVQGIMQMNLIQYEQRDHWLILVVLISGAAADVIIAVCLCYFLLSKRGSLFKRTVRLVDQLIALTLQTSLLTSLTTISILICYLTMSNFAWISIYVVMSRIFSNCLLASLNARTLFRESDRMVEFVSIPQLSAPESGSSETPKAPDEAHPKGINRVHPKRLLDLSWTLTREARSLEEGEPDTPTRKAPREGI